MKNLFPLHNPNLLLRQPVELVHQSINRGIRRLDLPLEQRFLVIEFRVLQLFVIHRVNYVGKLIQIYIEVLDGKNLNYNTYDP